MQITLKTGSDYILCNGSTRGVDLHVGPLDDFRGSLRATLQVDPIIDANNPKITDRGNRSGRLTINVECEKSSIEAAAMYAIEYPASIPRQGDIWITQDAKTVKLLAAGIEDISAVARGVRLYITYSIVYGEITPSS